MPSEMDIVSPVRTFVVENFLFGRNEGLTDHESFLESGIIDSTGIAGTFDFNLRYQSHAISSALQQQLGLKLEKGTGVLDLLIIENPAPPGSNVE